MARGEDVSFPPGWYADPTFDAHLRWWDGSQWNDHRAVAETHSASAAAERGWAAVSHLGIPFWSVFVPLVVWFASPVGSLRRRRARRAFSYQLLYLPFHLVFTARMAFGGSAAPLVVCILVGFLLELPQVARALRGKDPYPIPPFQLLRPWARQSRWVATGLSPAGERDAPEAPICTPHRSLCRRRSGSRVMHP